MSPKTAQFIFVALNIAAIPCVFYPIDSYMGVLAAANMGASEITFDSGAFFLLLMSIFWILYGLQLAGLKGHKQFVEKHGGKCIVTWFCLSVITALLLPKLLSIQLEEAGYQACEAAAQASRVSGGEEIVYSLRACDR